MKRIHYLTLMLAFLPGCGSIPDAPADSPSVSSKDIVASRTRLFSHTESFEEGAVIDAAASIINEKASLSSEQGESCWRTETSRPVVREACMLAWAAGKDASATLEAELIAHARKSRVLGIALIRREKLLSKLDLPALIAVLRHLGNEPIWLRGMAIEEWLKTGSPSSLMETQALWEASGVNIAALDPASAFYAYRIARKLGVGLEEELLGTYCNPTAASIAQVRCWRFLSAIVDPLTGLGLERSARAFLPQRREEGWILFERAFPERASLLRPYR